MKGSVLKRLEFGVEGCRVSVSLSVESRIQAGVQGRRRSDKHWGTRSHKGFRGEEKDFTGDSGPDCEPVHDGDKLVRRKAFLKLQYTIILINILLSAYRVEMAAQLTWVPFFAAFLSYSDRFSFRLKKNKYKNKFKVFFRCLQLAAPAACDGCTGSSAVKRRFAVSRGTVSRVWRENQKIHSYKRLDYSKTGICSFGRGGAHHHQQGPHVHVSGQTLRNRPHEGGTTSFYWDSQLNMTYSSCAVQCSPLVVTKTKAKRDIKTGMLLTLLRFLFTVYFCALHLIIMYIL